MIKFNWYTFLLLILTAHLALIWVLIDGSLAQISATIGIFVFECLFVSTAIYHRLLSHRSWVAPRWIEVVGTLIGIFTFTGTSITRTLSHRYHHRYSDTEKDPHSPRIVGSFRTYFPMLDHKRTMDLRMVRDLLSDPFHRWCHRHYFDVIVMMFFTTVFLFGLRWALAITVAPGALCWMNISICNIFCHPASVGGPINSRFLSLITFGEGWHQRHHENPDDANFGGADLDLGFLAVTVMRSKRETASPS